MTAAFDLCVLFAMTLLWFAHGKAEAGSWWSRRSALEHERSRDLPGSAQVGMNILVALPGTSCK